MRFKKLNSGKLVNVKFKRINWDKKVASNFQFQVKQYLKTYWLNHIIAEEFPIPGSRLRIDFLDLTKNVAVECQGEQHDKFNPFFHNKSRFSYLNSIKRDVSKRQWCDQNGFKLIEIYERDLPNLSREFFKEKFDVELI